MAALSKVSLSAEQGSLSGGPPSAFPPLRDSAQALGVPLHRPCRICANLAVTSYGPKRERIGSGTSPFLALGRVRMFSNVRMKLWIPSAA
ncbi:hypothetical protein AB0I81_04135 [Nonomuraea sp. NPDC050404]|uniref:hypothetical protein n=1 Tax=Nonomuraea sp. NPDC050404 TaxID=3155783 RepID=UPI0033D10628